MKCVYFIKGSGAEIKIGFATNLKRRIPSLRTSMPNMSILFYIESDEALELEHHFHILFEDKHVTGEWYMLEQDDIDLIKENYNVQYYDNLPKRIQQKGVLKESKIYSMNLETDTVDIIQQYCQEEGISLSNLTRKLFKQFIKENNLKS